MSARVPPVLAQRQRSLGRTLERLSSGLRINRAADDAAGMGVKTNLRSAWRSVQVARRNVEDAISAADIADGGLHEVADMLQRMRELAVASASETYGDDERAYLDDEFGELLDEVDRVANTTSFGGRRLLSPGAVEIIVFVDSSDSMGGEIASLQSALPSFRDDLQAAGIDIRLALVDISTKVDPLDGSLVRAGLTDSSAFDDALAAFSLTGVGGMDPYTVLTDVTGLAPVAGTDGREKVGYHHDAGQRIALYVSDATREVALSSETEASAAEKLAQAGIVVHSLVQTGPYSAVFDELSSETGGLMQNLDAFGASIPAALANIAADIEGKARPVTGLSVQAGIHDTDADRIEAGFPVDVTAVTLGIDQLDISSSTGAGAAIDALDQALDAVNQAFARVGATRNRLEGASVFQEDWGVALDQARGTIEDADVAVETSAMVRDRILGDAAGAAMVQVRGLERDAILSLIG